MILFAYTTNPLEFKPAILVRAFYFLLGVGIETRPYAKQAGCRWAALLQLCRLLRLPAGHPFLLPILAFWGLADYYVLIINCLLW